MKTQSLKLSEIVTTAGTQIRAKIDAEAVSDYADAMTDGAKFPPVVVFHDGSEYILADGFHRVMAAARNGFKDILAEIHKGTKSDALKYALGANSAHGIPRSRADKRRSVELALAEWAKMSDREVSKMCAVSASFVGDVRKANCSLTTVERIGGDGKTRKSPSKGPATIVDVDPEPPRVTQGEALMSAAASKVRRRRIVRLQPAAIAWLNYAKEHGAFMPSHMTNRRWRRYWTKCLGFQKWPQDICRHACATMLLALLGDVGKVSTSLGNSPGILMRHYADLCPPKTAEEFWSIMP